MRFLRYLLILGFITAGFYSIAQTNPDVKQPRILILLDGSSSMLEPWSAGQIRFKAAAQIITTLIDSVYRVNKDVEFALRVYGHQYPSQQNNCYDTKLEVMFSKDNLAQMGLRLEALHPLGVTPIAFSLKQAAEHDLVDPDRNNYSIILITDGGESCGGNLCDVVKELLSKKISFKPYILSLVDYAPLKQQYDCLGDYLLVTKEQDVTNAVNKIVEGYRPMIALDNTVRKLLQTTVVSAPSALKVNIPSFKVTNEVEEPTPPPAPKPKPKPIEKPQEVPAVVKPAAPTYDLSTRTNENLNRQLPKDTINSLGFISVSRILSQRYNTPSFRPIAVPAYIPPRIETYIDEKPMATAPVKQPSNLPVQTSKPAPSVVNIPKPTPPPVAAAAPVKPVPPPPTPKPAPAKPVPVETIKPKEAKFDAVAHEEAKETSFELYFTNGKGKFYQTSPQVILLDPKTGKEVNKFWREVDISGNPRPQKLPVGTYDLTIKGKNKIWRNVEIKENNKNKYNLIVSNASLRFEYEDDLEHKVPVTEYLARVKKNFEPGPVMTQRCSQEVEYEPGNYHIIINTNPVRHESQDLDFDSEVVIRIERPGYVQFTNTNDMGKVTLYYELGDQYVRFDELKITGNPDQQKKELQRGKYKVGYNKTPGIPGSQEIYKPFIVKSKLVTEVNLD